MTLFTSGCNFNCKYCHNKSLIKKTEGNISEEEVFSYFQKRINVLDALVVSGGEPTLYKEELIQFCKRFKERFPHKLLKIDTNGTFPDMIKKLSETADFCAMDLKSSNYSSFSNITMETIESSLRAIKSFKDFEIRTTLYPEYINKQNISVIINMIKSTDIYNITLQKYRPLEKGEMNFSDYDIKEINDIIRDRGVKTIIRGM
jgi:pyruvate formate lyase activating enzyme